jgi:hypothetical protein
MHYARGQVVQDVGAMDAEPRAGSRCQHRFRAVGDRGRSPRNPGRGFESYRPCQIAYLKSVLAAGHEEIIKWEILAVLGRGARVQVDSCPACSPIRNRRGRVESQGRALTCCDAFACEQSTVVTQPLQSAVRPSAELLTIADSDPQCSVPQPNGSWRGCGLLPGQACPSSGRNPGSPQPFGPDFSSQRRVGPPRTRSARPETRKNCQPCLFYSKAGRRTPRNPDSPGEGLSEATAGATTCLRTKSYACARLLSMRRIASAGVGGQNAIRIWSG